MNYQYLQRDAEAEERLYDLIALVASNPGVYIGEPSLCRLFHFIGGYSFSTLQLTGYRFHFENEFQAFVTERFPTNRTMNWSETLREGRTELQAFDLFRKLFSEFRTSARE